jgi:hypothetical protein
LEIYRQAKEKVMTEFKRGDIVQVMYASLGGPVRPMKGIVTGPEEQGLVAVDLGDEGEIVFSPESVVMIDAAPEGKTERVQIELCGSEDNTDIEGVYSVEETEVIIDLARKLNANQFFSLQPYMEVTVNGEKIVEWKEKK